MGQADRGIGPREGDSAHTNQDEVISLLEQWAAEEPSGYDEETLPALKESLDRNRPEYRKIFVQG